MYRQIQGVYIQEGQKQWAGMETDIGGEAEERLKKHEVKSTHDTRAWGKQNYIIISRMENTKGRAETNKQGWMETEQRR